MGEVSYKAAKGLIRIKVQIKDNKIDAIMISGDFFMYPEDKLWKLESLLVGTAANRKDIASRIKRFYDASHILTPGVTPEDFTEAIMRGIAVS